MISRAELGAWLRLLQTPGLGRDAARKLLAAFGSPEAVLEATPAAWLAVVPGAKVALLGRPAPSGHALLDATCAWLAGAGAGPRGIVTLGDPDYPAALLQAPDPPLLLYLLGRRELAAAPAVAIVGSRNPTPQGAENAHAFARDLSLAGLTIVSGLARGVDAAAHAGALEGAGGTIAIVGTGLDIVYPRSHASLARRIASEGLLISEYPLGAPPLADHFPRRNRLIAGLARGTLVVEAALRSGSLITARLANEAGREVFAIPGSIHSPLARGCHALIRQGAKLVETAHDVLEELQMPAPAPVAAEPDPAATGDDAALLAALGHDPVTLDALAARTGRSAAELSVRLMTLELDGRVERLPGQLFQCAGHARR